MNDLVQVVEKIRRDAEYWAPERRVAKLLPYLLEYGYPLELALLRGLTPVAQTMVGITEYRQRAKSMLATMLTGIAPIRNRMRGKPPEEVKAFARQQLYRMLVEELLVKVDAERVALTFVIDGVTVDSDVNVVGTFDEVSAEVERLAERYELKHFSARAAKPDETSQVWEP